MNNIKVSVIVPIYKVESFIECCARSLFEQTLDHIEYIFVNDCTPDDSIGVLLSVMEDYPSRKDQVKIVNHEINRGSAAARNTGLLIAGGKYIIHCDGDDWVEEEMYEELFNRAIQTGADIVGCSFFDDIATHSIIHQQEFPSDPQECVCKMLRGDLHCATWNKLITKSLYERTNIHFTEGVNMWEDVSVIIPLTFHANKIETVHYALYHYIRDNESSYTYRVSSSSLDNMIKTVESLELFFKANQCTDVFAREFCYMKLTVKLNLLLGSKDVLQKEWNSLYPSANRYIFSYSSMSIYWKLALWLASIKLLFVFNIMSFIGKKIR